MKQITAIIIVLIGISSKAQSDYYNVLPTDGSTSSLGAAPQGYKPYNRTVWLITAAEMTNSGFTSGSIVNSLGFNYTTALVNPVTSTTFRIYMQNTTNTTNTKSTNWATAITGMTSVSNANITLPTTTGIFHFPFSGGSTFTYTGGGLYIAFDYQEVTGFGSSAPSFAATNTSLANGIKSVTSLNWQAPPPTTLSANYAFRPETFLGKLVNCARPHFLDYQTINPSTVNLTWSTNGPTGQGYTMQYGLDGYTFNVNPIGNNIAIPASATSYPITGLLPSTVYQYYIKKNCDVSNSIQSMWSGPYPFYTTFQSANLPYVTGFETYAPDYMGWNAQPNANGADWFIYKDPGNPLIASGSSALVSVSNSNSANITRVTSRGINLTAGQQVTINFDFLRLDSTSPVSTAYSVFTFYVSNSPNGPYTEVTGNPWVLNIVPNDIILATETYTPATTGTYYFSFVNETQAETVAGAYCGYFIDNFKVRLTSSLATENIDAELFSVVPNPASDVVYVTNSSNSSIENITITDLNGRLVKQLPFLNTSNAEVNVADLSKGVYLMKITAGEVNVIKKIIKN